MELSTLLLASIPLLISLGVAYAMGFFSDNAFDVRGRTVIVTGGSQGMGLEVAKQFAAKGANVVIVARDQTKLQKAIDEIRTAATIPNQWFHTLSYDLTDPASAPKIVSEVTKRNQGHPPDVLFNCAGYCVPGFFASTSLDVHRSQMDVLYWSCAYMSHAVLTSWMASSTQTFLPRHIVFTSSLAGLYPVAGYAAYSPAKAAMRALADTLNQEVAVYNGARQSGQKDVPPADIKIHIIYPMGILSPGYENEQKSKPDITKQLEKEDKPQTPAEVARLAIARLEAGDYMITTQFNGHAVRGAAIGTSVKNGLVDLVYMFIGSIAMLFVVPDYLGQCDKWGKSKGMASAR